MRKIYSKINNIKIINLYGCVETTADITYHFLDKNKFINKSNMDNSIVHIGKCMDNNEVAIFDDNMKLVNKKEKGFL